MGELTPIEEWKAYKLKLASEGLAICDRCRGVGEVTDRETGYDKICTVCDGKGHITQERAEQRAKIADELGQILANALANTSGDSDG